MLFMNKMQMKSAVRAYSLAIKKEFLCDQSKSKSWKVICKRHELGCDWMIRFREISSGMWKTGKMIEPHTCLTDNYKEDHFNLNDNMIATSLIPYVMQNPDINIKMIREIIKGKHHYTPSYRKAQKGRRKAFRMVYGDFESSFKALPRYMAALQLFNPGTIIEWEHHSTTMQGEQIFKFLFWAFKQSIDGFKSCRPVISIDGTHLYGLYDIKLLIAVGIDANGNIFPLAYALVARESFESWSWFLKLLWTHVVCERQGIGLISDRHQGILQCVQSYDWLSPPNTYHRFCVRHLKANFNKKFVNSELENLMWLAATEHQEKKFMQRMQQIKTLSPAAYEWLNEFPLEKWTMYKDGGRRWGAMTTNVSESYNGLLKKARGLPVTAMVRMTFKALVDRFVERNNLAIALLQSNMPWPLAIDKKFNDYYQRAQGHTDMMTYNTGDGVFEILTFAHDGKGGNVHKVTAKGKKCSCGKWRNYHMPCSHAIKFCGLRGIEPKSYVSKFYSAKYYKRTYSETFNPVGDEMYWPPAPFNLIANTEYLRTSGTQERSRLKNDMDIAPARMTRKCSVCKETGHTKARCPTRF